MLRLDRQNIFQVNPVLFLVMCLMITNISIGQEIVINEFLARNDTLFQIRTVNLMIGLSYLIIARVLFPCRDIFYVMMVRNSKNGLFPIPVLKLEDS